MTVRTTRTGDVARVALGLSRLTFGSLGLVAPRLMVGRIQGPGAESSAAVYAFRMFGIRTVLIGRQLLTEDGPQRRSAVATAPLIHATDTLTATLLTVNGDVPRRTGLSLVCVSGLNTALALAATRSRALGHGQQDR